MDKKRSMTNPAWSFQRRSSTASASGIGNGSSRGNGRRNDWFTDACAALDLDLDKVDKNFELLLERVRAILTLQDIEDAELETKRDVTCKFFGICMMGVCLFQIARALVLFLQTTTTLSSGMLKTAAEDRREAPFANTISQLLNLMTNCKRGPAHISILLTRPDARDHLIDLTRAIMLHPNRDRIMEAEGEQANGLGHKGRLFAKSTGNRTSMFMEAVDALFTLMLTEVALYDGDVKSSVIRRAHGLPSSTGDVLDPPHFPDCRDELVGIVTEKLWLGIDENYNGNLEACEVRELLRSMLSRPAFSILVREHMMLGQRRIEETEDEYMARRSPRLGSPRMWNAKKVPDEVQKRLGIQAAIDATLSAAYEAETYGAQMWQSLDGNGNNAVTGQEFKDAILQAFEEEVLAPCVERATEAYYRLESRYFTEIKDTAAPKSQDSDSTADDDFRSSELDGKEDNSESHDGDSQGAWTLTDPSTWKWGTLFSTPGEGAQPLPDRGDSSPSSSDSLTDGGNSALNSARSSTVSISASYAPRARRLSGARLSGMTVSSSAPHTAGAVRASGLHRAKQRSVPPKLRGRESATTAAVVTNVREEVGEGTKASCQLDWLSWWTQATTR